MALAQWDAAVADAPAANIAAAAREMMSLLLEMGAAEKASGIVAKHLSEWVMVNLDELSLDDEAKARAQPLRHTARQELAPSSQTLPSGTTEANGDIASVVQALGSPFLNERVEAAGRIRHILSMERNPPISLVIQLGAIPPLVESLQNQNEHVLQLEAAWALTNIASGPSGAVDALVRHGALPGFVRLLSSPNEDVREQAVWGLGNIAGDSSLNRDQVLACGALPPLLGLFSNATKLSLMRHATWALSNFVRGKPSPPAHIAAMALPALASLVHHQEIEVQTDALWALSYLTDGENARIQAVLDTGVLPRVVQLLSHSSPQVQTPALRCVGNIATGDNEQAQALLDLSALPPLHAMLSHPKKSIQKEACWTFSNITAGTLSQVQAVLEAEGVIPALVELSCSADFEIRKDATWALSNALEAGTPEHVAHLVQQDCLRGFGTALGDANARLALCALEGVSHVLDKGAELAKLNAVLAPNAFHGYLNQLQLAEKITALTKHAKEEVQEKARVVVQRHLV